MFLVTHLLKLVMTKLYESTMDMFTTEATPALKSPWQQKQINCVLTGLYSDELVLNAS